MQMIQTQVEDRDRLLLVDGHAVIYRAYHAFPELSDQNGQLINAVYGFTRILLKSINDFQPKYIAVAFDHKKGKSRRVASYQGYKAQRKPMPDDLLTQIPIIKEIVRAFNIPQFELENFEADDILGTIARVIKEQNTDILTTILTGDKDLLQLVDDRSTHVFIPGRGRFTHDIEYDEVQVKKKLGITPKQVIDLKALMGDASDNIPGVKGVGIKTATKLLNEFETLEKIYDYVDQLTSDSGLTHQVLKGSVLKKITTDKQMAFLSKELATIMLDAPIEFSLKSCMVQDYDKDQVTTIFDYYNFTSLKQLLPKDKFESSVQEALF